MPISSTFTMVNLLNFVFSVLIKLINIDTFSQSSLMESVHSFELFIGLSFLFWVKCVLHFIWLLNVVLFYLKKLTLVLFWFCLHPQHFISLLSFLKIINSFILLNFVSNYGTLLANLIPIFNFLLIEGFEHLLNFIFGLIPILLCHKPILFLLLLFSSSFLTSLNIPYFTYESTSSLYWRISSILFIF